jgi:hypothetical protein
LHTNHRAGYLTPDHDEAAPSEPNPQTLKSQTPKQVLQDGDLPEQEEAPAEPAEGEEPPPPPPTFPEDAEVFVWLELSKLLVPLDELPLLNIVTFTVSAMHNIPER